MRRIDLRPEARQDLLDAVVWYEDRQAGLGVRFFDSADAAIDKAVADPERFAEYADGVRRVLVDHFPYTVFYKAFDEYLIIYGVIHQHRSSAHIQQRLD